MRLEGSSSVGWLVALLLVQSQGACRGSESGHPTPTHPVGRATASPSAPAPAPADMAAGDPGEIPDDVASFRTLLSNAGITTTGVMRLESRQELPACPEAELRYRFFLGDRAGFFNASRYGSGAEAQSCRDDFQEMALKGGASAWERLQRDVFVKGSWLILFPPESPTKEIRDRVLRAIGPATDPAP